MSNDHLKPNAGQSDDAGPGKVQHFIRAIIAADLESGKYNGRVATRFPPEPNGFLHIGHAKAICLNFGIAMENQGGTCNLRFDDTNPTTEDIRYVESIQRDIRWLGFDWADRLFFTSDYFEKLFGYAVSLIESGKAYVCSLNEEEIRAYRGSVLEAGRHSPFRERSIGENLDLFQRMRAGEFADGAHVLRAKIDMAAANMKMRDPLLYRIRHAHHYRSGDAWCVYPMYDFAHCVSDAIEGITHSLCTLEFENNRELYDWILKELGFKCPPQQFEFARLNLTHTVMSKRKLLTLVEGGYVSGWDDPRMPTLAGMRRRGYTPEAIRDFCERIGIAKANSVASPDQLEFSLRNDLNARAPRVMAVARPLRIIIDNYPKNRVETLDAPLFPHDIPKKGSRELPFSREIFIEADDFCEHPPKGFHRLAPGCEVRLRHAYVIGCEEVVRDHSGEIAYLRCVYDPATLGINPTDRKVKGTIHWVSAAHALSAELRLYDQLFKSERPDGDSDVDFKTLLNPQSLTAVQGFVEPFLGACKPGDSYQFERLGYFCSDIDGAEQGKLVFNRTVTLRDSWAKQLSKAEAGTQPKPAVSVPKPARKSPAKAAADRPTVARETQPAHPTDPAATARFDYLVNTLGLGSEEAHLLAGNYEMDRLFEDALAHHNQPRTIANWIVNELAAELKGLKISALPFGGRELGQLVGLVDSGKISGTSAKQVLAILVEQGGDPEAIVEARGLAQLDSDAALAPVVAKVLADHPDEAERLRGGEEKLLGFFMGRIMKATGGRANPTLVTRLLKEALTQGG